jgi:hypothetical protein
MTVAIALAHMQYWDGRAVGAIEAWRRHGLPLTLWTNDEAVVNDKRLPLWRGLAPREALEQGHQDSEGPRPRGAGPQFGGSRSCRCGAVSRTRPLATPLRAPRRDRWGAQRVLRPDGRELRLPEDPIYFLRWELVTTARLYDALPADVQRIG